MKRILLIILFLLVGCATLKVVSVFKGTWWQDKMNTNEIKGNKSVRVCIADQNFSLTHSDAIFNYQISKDLTSGTFELLGEENGIRSYHGTACLGVANQSCVGCDFGIIRLDDSKMYSKSYKLDALMFADSCGCDVFSISIVPRLLYGDSIFLDNLNEDIERFIDTTDMIIVTAAGNEGIPYMGAIAMHPKVVSVVALDIDNKMSFYSNYSKDKISFGGYVDNGIFTYDLPGKQGENSSDYIVDFAGTSASCAMIAGAIGLAKSNGLSIDKITDTIFVRDSIIVKVLKF